jgi:glycerol-1-phosphate dehydrogenase [NAD(P)+]
LIASVAEKHLMELPRAVLIGGGVFDEVGNFMDILGLGASVGVVSGPNVKKLFQNRVTDLVQGSGRKVTWIEIHSPVLSDVNLVEDVARQKKVLALVGLGGGKSLDVAKLAAFEIGLPFLSVPTSASHDGISSPFASIRGSSKPYSHVTKPPIGILADVDVISKCDPRLLSSGCGDLMAKVTAVRDWELAHKETGEYYGSYAANLALLSAQLVMQDAKGIGERRIESIKSVVEALISAGVAAGIAGSSRPCSGSEHLFSHALEKVAHGKGLHGEKCGVGCIMICELHGIDGGDVRKALTEIGAPTTARELGVGENEIVESLRLAPSLRPERYTILTKLKLTDEEARRLARRTRVT